MSRNDITARDLRLIERLSVVFGRSICFFGLLLAAPTAFGAKPTFVGDQEYLIDTWEAEDGLPENSAMAMAQTRDGYLWFGTLNGLVRFDGVKLTVFDPANTPQLPSPSVVNLHLDQRERLWISTYRGVVIHEGSRWRALQGTEDYLIRSFAERRNGDLLLTTFDGTILQFADDRLTQLPTPPDRPNNGYIGLVDETDRWWVAQIRYVGSWDGHAWTDAAALTNLNSDITGAGAARDGGIWLKAGSALYKLRSGMEVARIPLPSAFGNPWSITEDGAGNVWIPTINQGLWRIRANGDIRQWTDANGLSSNNARFAFKDREDNLWVGTSGGGLQRFSLRRAQSYGPENGLLERNVTSVWPDSADGIWAATFGKGMFRWSGGSIKPERLLREDRSLDSMTMTSVLTDHKARTWIGSWGLGLHVIDSRGFHPIPLTQTGPVIFSLFEDSRGRIWVGGNRETTFAEAENTHPVRLRSGDILSSVRCFAEDPAGTIWASTQEGLFRCESDHFVEVLHQGKSLRDIASLKFDADGTLWLGQLGRGLLCRKDEKLARVDLGFGQSPPGIYGILEDDAGFFWMPSNHGVLRAARRDLLAVVSGELDVAKCLAWGLSDGLLSADCSNTRQPNCARDANGRLWFATLKGISVIDPANLHLNTNPPPVQIESIVYQAPSKAAGSFISSVFSRKPLITDAEALSASGFLKREDGQAHGEPSDKSKFSIDAPFPRRVVLPAGSRNIEFRYTAPTFVAPEKTRFQVMLEGLDTDWRDVTAQRTKQFENLPPQEYVFRVRAMNNDRVWNETGASLAFVLQPFFWQTIWFRGGVVLLLINAGGVAAWLRLRRKHKRALVELERQRRHQAQIAHLDRLATMGQLASSIVHELAQPLGAILSNADAAEAFLQQEPPNLDEVRDIIEDIRKDDQRAGTVISRMRSLALRREITRTPLDLNELAREVVGLVRPDSLSRKVQLKLEVPSSPMPANGDSPHLQQVLLNLILNAMDATKDLPPDERRVTVKIQPTGTEIEISVYDEGHGLPSDCPDLFEPFFTTKPQGMGMGLPISKTIVEAHGGRIWAESNATRGATFRFTVPALNGKGPR